jgi:hypothetical protein
MHAVAAVCGMWQEPATGVSLTSGPACPALGIVGVSVGPAGGEVLQKNTQQHSNALAIRM